MASKFQYATTASGAKQAVFMISSNDAFVNCLRKYKITDIKLSGGISKGKFTLYTSAAYGSSGIGKILSFNVGSTENTNFTWSAPYEFGILGSSGGYRYLYASATPATLTYTISGYVE
jgi:hypothetical protein